MSPTSIPAVIGQNKRRASVAAVAVSLLLSAVEVAAVSAAPGPSFGLSPASLSLSAKVGETATASVTLTTKKAVVVQSPATFTDSHFSDTRAGTCWSIYESNNAAIPSKTSCTIQVSFGSSTPGTFSGTMRISECDASHPTSGGLVCDTVLGSQSINLTGTATGQSDLVVQSIVLDGPGGGFALQYGVTVANAGTAGANVRGVGVRGWYSSDSSLGGDTSACSTVLSPTNLVLIPGGTRTVTIGCDTAPASTDAFLLVEVDPTNVVHESDESNNVGAQALPYVDLVVDSITIHGADANASFNYTVTIKNIGTAALTFGDDDLAVRVQGYYSEDPALDGSDPFACGGLFTDSAGLAAGATADVDFACDAHPANIDNYFLARVDDANAVAEVDETNNVGRHVLPSPDLTVAGITIEGANASHAFNSTVTIGLNITEVTVPVDLGGVVVQTWYSSDDVLVIGDDTPACNAFVPDHTPLTPGHTLDVSVPCATAPAETDNYLFVQVDFTDHVAESDQLNNLGSAPLPAVDLVSEAVSFAPSDCCPNSWTVTIRNKGNKTVDLSNAIVAGYYNDIDSLGESEIGACGTTIGGTLAGGATTDVIVNCSRAADPTDAYLIVVVDQGNFVAESNEDNNVSAYALGPDLTISQIVIDPNGDAPFDYTVTVKNNTATAVDVAGVIIQGYFSVGSTLTPDNSAACGLTISTSPLVIPGGGTTDVAVGCGFVPSDSERYLIVDVDSGNTLAERDESNNRRAVPLGIDLTVTSVVAEGASSGGDFTWRATIENLGGVPYSDATSDAAVVQAYLSTDDAFDVSDTSLGFCRTILTAPDLVLRAGESTDVEVACHAEPRWGSDYLLVVADDSGGVPETDETNNVGSVLTPAVDLTISSIVVDETQLSGRYAFDVTVHIDTTVPIETNGVGILTYYSSDQFLDDGDNPACSAIQTDSNIVSESGDFQTFRISCTTLPGPTDSFLIVKLDYLDVIHEFNEDNNVEQQTLTTLS